MAGWSRVRQPRLFGPESEILDCAADESCILWTSFTVIICVRMRVLASVKTKMSVVL